jgi:hypothetical protein
MKYRVNYNESAIRTIIVEAESPEEAERMVYEGDEDVDYSESSEDDSTIVCINSVEVVTK